MGAKTASPLIEAVVELPLHAGLLEEADKGRVLAAHRQDSGEVERSGGEAVGWERELSSAREEQRRRCALYILAEEQNKVSLD